MPPERLKRSRLPVSVSVGVLIERVDFNKDQPTRQLLLVQQARPEKERKWGIPAGGIEAHENPIVAAQKEAREELGVGIVVESLARIYTLDRGNTGSGLAFVFWGSLVCEELAPPPSEIVTARYFSYTEIEKLWEQDQIYKPEYNRVTISDWHNDARSYPLSAIAPLIVT